MSNDKNITLTDFVAGVLHEIDPSLTAVSTGYSEACILVASIATGANENVIADGLSYDPEFVALVGNRLRNAKLWVGDHLAPAALARWRENGIALSCDINVAIGDFLIAAYADDGEPQYSLTPSGKSHVENMLKAP